MFKDYEIFVQVSLKILNFLLASGTTIVVSLKVMIALLISLNSQKIN